MKIPKERCRLQISEDWSGQLMLSSRRTATADGTYFGASDIDREAVTMCCSL